jgi:hypothetical protein
MSAEATIDVVRSETAEAPGEPRTGRRRRWDTNGVAASAAALLSMAAFCLALALRHTYPFGHRSRAVNDLANQFLPFHEHLWDLEHGVSSGDMFFNWNSGYGVPFLADFFTYLCNPFSWFVGLFPRDMVDLPVFLVTLFSIGLGTGLMTVFLGRLHAGSPWWRALLAVGYGLCSWVLNDGFADPMWMWGIVALPLLGIATDWCVQGRHWVIGTLFFAAAWVGNFYTGAMATIAVGLILLTRVLLMTSPLRDRLRILGRAGTMVAVGVLLAAPIMTVDLPASTDSQPPPPNTFTGAFPPALDVLAQLLPAGRETRALPDVFVGIFALVLVAAFPFHRLVPLKERLVWLGLLVVTMFSFLWEPTLLVWHGLALPNGSPYRASFVFAAMLVIVAWLSLARRPRPAALLIGSGLVLALLLVSRDLDSVRHSVWVSVLLGGPAVLVSLLALYRWRDSRWVRGGAALVLTGTVFFGSAYSAYVAEAIRSKIPFFTPMASMATPQARSAYTALQAARTWPDGRVEPGPYRFANNDGALLNVEGSRYYSSYLPAATAEALQGLGISWTISGRHIHSPTDPVTRALMGVTTYLDPAPAPQNFTVTPAGPTAPLVTVHPAGAVEQPGTTVFARQQALLGATVYQVPKLSYATGPEPTRTDGGWQLTKMPKDGRRVTFSATCAPGTDAYFYTPWLDGWVRGPANDINYVGRESLTSNPMELLGTVPADGKVKIAIYSRKAQVLPDASLGCLDKSKLTAAIANLRATGATRIEAGGHSIDATLPAGSTGVAVLAVPAVKGWACSSDGGRLGRPSSAQGFLAVPLDGGASSIHCTFQTPGLKSGLALSGLALVIILATTGTAMMRRRRAGQSPEETGPPAGGWRIPSPRRPPSIEA